MGKLLTFFLLTELTGSPWTALLVVVAVYWALDRSTTRVLPGPWAAFRRAMERRRLRAALANNPHDFRNELELGRLLLESRRYADARPHLDRAAEAYSTDASVKVLRAVARVGAGDVEPGLAELDALMAANPRLRFGEPWLDAGEILLRRGEAGRAKEMIARFLQMQPSNVKGLYLLARAQAKSGDAAGARVSRRQAWSEYATNPRFKQREARVWAYRANPLRPLMYAAGVFAAIAVVAALYAQK